MKSIKIEKDKYSLPESWDELSENDIRLIIRITKKPRPKNQTLAIIAMGLLGLKVMNCKPVVYDLERHKLRKATSGDAKHKYLYYIRSGITNVYLIASEDLAQIAQQLEWMFSSPQNGSIHLKSRLASNPIHKVRIKNRIYEGPGYLFDGVRWGQFTDAEVCWAMVAEGDISAASRAMASLYTLIGGEDEAKTKQKYKDFERLSIEDITLFSLYYEGAKLHLFEHYDLFSNNIEHGMGSLDTTPVSIKVHENFISTTNLLSNLNLNEIEKTRSAYLYDALNILKQNKLNNEQWKRDSTL